jgi:hypothetical protein
MTDRHPRIIKKIDEDAWAVWPSTEADSPRARRVYRRVERRAESIGREFAEDVVKRQSERKRQPA